ncbi:MAG: hypothetical protein RBG13Loki_2615 [Promethearchaeota archaeon CR_4]|nr:MAG: hypothetical protein RBG13Loki_2615 [Candidatus Lokiarchaeota archaeon CR_4]
MPSLYISAKLKGLLDKLKGKLSESRKVAWSEVIEELIVFYARKDEIEQELDRLQKIVEDIAIKNATFLAGGGVAGRPVAYANPAIPFPSYGGMRGMIPTVPPPPPGLMKPPGAPNSPQDDLRTQMVQELNQLFDAGVKLQPVDAAVREEEEKKTVELTKKAIEIIGEELADRLPAAKNAILAILRDKTEDTGTLFVMAKNVIQELKKALKMGTDEILTEFDSLLLMAKQDPTFIKQELESKRGSPEFREALEKVKEPLASVLKQIARIRMLMQ